MNRNDRIELLRSGGIGKALWTLAMPAVIAMFVNAVYNVVDTAFIGLLHDTASIGASAVLFPIFMLIAAIGLTFGMGAASVISRKLGENKPEHARRTASTAFYTSVIAGIIFAVLGNVFIEPLLRLFGATDTILEKAVIYGRIIIGGSIFQVLNMCMNNILRAEGAAGYSGRALMLGGILNIILDPIFMFVFKMGLAGAAAATITAQFISTIYLLRFFIMKKGILSIRIMDFHPTRAIYHGIMTIGIPTFARQVFMSISMGMLNSAAGLYGDAAVAAVGITLRVISLVMMVIFGIGQGLQPLAGYNYGARQYDRVIKSTRKAIIWSVSFAAVMSVVFWIAAGRIVSLFSQDPMVVEIGIKALRFTSTTLVLVGIQNSYGILFQALGKGLQAAILAIARQGLFFIPAVLILPRLFGLNGVIVTQVTADVLSIMVTIPLAIIEVKHLRKLINPSGITAEE
ncbi:MAG: MATE family efflux transporter [Spirochaetales bacterium]|nr:MATE family efflux transporter [Spirochaetales bacterium]